MRVRSNCVKMQGVRTTKRHSALPIGRTARMAYDIDALREDCCRAARALVRRQTLNEAELEECARLDDALAKAHWVLKSAVRNVMLSRLSRRSRIR